jgi:uncharacterized membrane protein YbhN (UPF0104 family)
LKKNITQKFITLFKFVSIFCIFFYLYNKYSIEFKNFYFLDTSIYLICIIFIFGSIITHSFRWFLIIKKKIYVQFLDVTIVILKSLFISTFTPSIIGFDAFRIYYLKKKKLSNRFATFSIFVDRLSGLFVMFLFLTFFLKELFFYYLGYNFNLIFIFLLLFLIFLTFIFLTRKQFLNYTKILSNIYNIKDGLNLVIVSIINFLCLLFSVYLLLYYGSGHPIKFEIFIISILFIFLSSIPITPQNIGITEFIILFLAEKNILLTINPDLLIVPLIQYRILQTIIFLLGSLFFFKSIQTKK